MQAIPLSRERVALARRQTAGAIFGLSVLLLVCLLMGAAGVVTALFGAAQSEAGHPVRGALAFGLAGGWMWLAARVLRCLATPVPHPEGVRLCPARAAELHALVNDIGARCGGLKVHSVRVTGDMNAAILQRPRRGLWGRMENHLLVGLPLAHSVSARQLEAIVAHEFGHLHCQRRGLAAWGGHLRAWWFRAIDRCFDLLPPLGALLDHLTLSQLRRAQTLCRMEEFEADLAAARLVGSASVAGALIEVALKEGFLTQDYWAKVMAQSRFHPRPTIRPYREMGCGMLAGYPAWHGRRDFLLSMFAEDDGGDLHPSLSERLAAIGERLGSAPPQPIEESAAQRYLEAELEALAWVFDRDWWSRTRNDWRAAYRDARRCSRRTRRHLGLSPTRCA